MHAEYVRTLDPTRALAAEFLGPGAHPQRPPLFGATTSTLRLSNLTAADAGDCILTVSGGAGSTSASALLVVMPESAADK